MFFKSKLSLLSQKYSVIIPFYNASSTIERSLNSILEQTLPADEIIIVDDCSDQIHRQALLHIVMSFATKIKIHVELNQVNKGPSFSRNKGITLSTNSLIAFLDSDDSWNPHKNEFQVMSILSHDADLISTDSVCVNSLPFYDRINTCSLENKTTNYSIRDACFSGKVSTSSILGRKTKKLRFNNRIKYCEDKDLFMTHILSNSKVIHLNIPLTYKHKFHYGEAGLSSNLWKMYVGDINVIYRSIKSYPIISILGILYASCKFAYRLFNVLLIKHSFTRTSY